MYDPTEDRPASSTTEGKPSSQANSPAPLVSVAMGSRSDLKVLQEALNLLEALGVPHEAMIVSAHRTPDWMNEYARDLASRGIEVVIAAAGGAAHLPGMIAAQTLLPVLGVPVEVGSLGGVDALLSIVQMPRGVAVGTLAVGPAGAFNAALLAAQIVAGSRPELKQRLAAWRESRRAHVMADRSIR